MNPNEPPTIEQLIERMPTDRTLALIINQMLELQAEIEIVRELITEQMTANLYEIETQAFEKRISERRIKLLAALSGKLRTKVETDK